MLDVAALPESPWPEHDWEALALRAEAAIRQTPYLEWLTNRASIEIAVRLTGEEPSDRPAYVDFDHWSCEWHAMRL